MTPAGVGLRPTRSRVMTMTLLVSSFALMSACVPRPRMCTASSECANNAKSVCVAGRCQVEAATMKPAVDSARRLVVRPVDMAYVKTGDGPAGGALPTVFAPGRDGGKLFLRFSVVVPPTANVVEAYVVLHRSPAVDDDPAPVSLHATRIVESWSGGSVQWAIQPRTSEARSPSTVVEPGGSPLVRVDVRELVRHWARRDPIDQGIAVVADGETRTGTTFALSAVGAERAVVEPAVAGRGGFSQPGTGQGTALDVEPYLELYVR